MKVALISCCPVRYMPYLELHRSILEKKRIDYIIINEHEIDDKLPANQYTYKMPVQHSVLGKIKKFLGWRIFVRRILKQHTVDYVVLLTTWPGVKLIDLWVRRYKNRYILDIRDFTDEDQKWYSKCVNRLVKKSYMTIVSSERFKTWLVDSPKISVVHNMPIKYEVKMAPTLGKEVKFSIGYVGLVNYEKQNKALIEAFSNSDNVHLIYKGMIQKSCHIKEYCEKHEIKNVTFTGRYSNSEKERLYDDVDMINAIYGNDSLVVTTALPNKLYDCIIYKKPMIASKGTYLGELVQQYHLGIVVDTDADDISSVINDYVSRFNCQIFLSGCEKLIKKVTQEHQETIEKMKKMYKDS